MSDCLIRLVFVLLRKGMIGIWRDVSRSVSAWVEVRFCAATIVANQALKSASSRMENMTVALLVCCSHGHRKNSQDTKHTHIYIPHKHTFFNIKQPLRFLAAARCIWGSLLKSRKHHSGTGSYLPYWFFNNWLKKHETRKFIHNIFIGVDERGLCSADYKGFMFFHFFFGFVRLH